MKPNLFFYLAGALIFCALFACQNRSFYSDVGVKPTVVSAPAPAPVPAPTELPADECVWGYAGPAYFECGETAYVYGIMIACPSGVYHNVFCPEELMSNGRLCSADSSPETQRCFMEKIGKHFPH